MDALPADLSALAAPVAVIAKEVDIPEIRQRLLLEAACSVGARGGLAARSQEIRGKLASKAADLDRIFSFQTVMLPSSLLPPVITEALESVRQDDGRTIRYAGAIYRIVEPERLVTVAPTWRDYLYTGLTDAATVEMPHDSMLPKTQAERDKWSRNVKDCWAKGVAQADTILQMNLDRIQRDFTGMLRYRLLALKGMVVEPRVGVERQATSGNGSELVIDDQTFRISTGTRFQLEDRKWK